MKISVVIPTLNEAENLPSLLSHLVSYADEVIVADGGSTDGTAEEAGRYPVKVIAAPPGRATQMNAGAQKATGEILFFLHADTTPPPRWRDDILQALSSPEVVGGGFRVQIDAPGIRYRFLDFWGGFRVRWKKTFTGDQGIFVRRNLFESMGGFSELSPVEDLEFSVRLKRQGKVAILPGPLRTSARRWESGGFFRTVMKHSRMVLEAPPTAQRIAVVIMAKNPVPGNVKTRLCPPLTPVQAALLAEWLLKGTVQLVRGLPGIQPILAVAPAECVESLKGRLSLPIPWIPQVEGDLGSRLSHVFDKLFAQGFLGVIALGADHPNLPRGYLARAVRLLQSGADRLILGPTEDGGYYLIGLNKPHPGLFQEIPWSTSQVLSVTLQKAKAQALRAELLPSWFDIDRPEDLNRLGFPWGARFAR